jgi:hypothetical protein
VTDALDRLVGPAGDLLSRVDATLARFGAPAWHPVWPLLRRLRALPGEAVGAFAVVEPAPLADAAAVLRPILQGYAEARATLPDRLDWSGVAAEAFTGQWVALGAHLDGGPPDLCSRLAATVSYVDALADWLAEARSALARTLAKVLGSAEAVQVRTAADAVAAAGIAALVLAVLAEVHERGAQVRAEFGAELEELGYRPPVPVVRAAGATTEVPL